MLCEKCSNIHFKRLEECEAMQQEPSRLTGDDGQYNISGCLFYFHHDNKQDLESSANLGCHFCAMLLRRLFKESSRGFINTWYFSRGEVIFRRSVVAYWNEGDSLEKWNADDWIYINCETRDVTTTSTFDYPKPVATMLQALTMCNGLDQSRESDRRFQCTSNYIEEGKMLVDHVPTQNLQIYSPRLDTSTTSPAAISLASTWLENCLKNHKPCRNVQNKQILPSRIIDISDPQHPFLDDGNGREAQYITLSYKWGDSRRFVTTTKNLSDHKKEIPLTDMPLTFKEAIHVTSTLGFRWLWIDALCIIQDSEEDQICEIGAMDQIFSSSVLTLFAAAGDNAIAGLSAIRDPRWVKPCQLTIRTTLDGQTYEALSYLTLDGGESLTPLFARGWVLQEQVLATRGLVFGNRELTWRCLCGHSTETRPAYRGRIRRLRELGNPQYNKWRNYSPGWDGFDTLRMWLQSNNPLPDRTPWQRDNQFDMWYKLVKDYSRRKLTYPADVMPALVGLASAMAKKHGCSYAAGLWKEDLQTGLLWYVSGAPDENLNTGGLDLPSWSWVAHWGKKIDFRGWENNNRLIEHEGAKLVLNSSQQEDPSPNQFGTIRTKQLYLTGLLKLAVVDRSPERQQRIEYNHRENARWLANIKDPISGETVGQIALDSDPEKESVSPIIHCLLCTVREKYHKWQLTCLALVPTDLSMSNFVRVGLVFIRRTDWFGEFDEIDPTIHEWVDAKKKDPTLTRTIRVS